jgi:cation transport regulator ChaC
MYSRGTKNNPGLLDKSLDLIVGVRLQFSVVASQQIGYGLFIRRVVYRIPAAKIYLFLLLSAQTGSLTHPP